MGVWVLRLGHRRERDVRLTTHVALVARAFGCDGIILSGEKDDSVIKSVRKVVEKWGGHFEIKYERNWKKVIKRWGGKKVHLTMYGIPVDDEIKRIRRYKNILVIVGSEKVPSEVFELVDWNISITNQPHSEAAALAIFLDRYFAGKELRKKFEDAKVEVIPQKRGKKIIKLK